MRDLNNDDDDNLDKKLDELLGEHFAGELDGQLGRAPAALTRSSRRSLGSSATASSSASRGATSSRRLSSGSRLAWAGFTGMALAAGIAGALLFGPLVTLMRPTGTSTDAEGNLTGPQLARLEPAPLQTEPVAHQIRWNTIDQGTVFVNGEVPMRSIRRQRIDNLRWVDPKSNATYQMSVPHDEVLLIGLNPN